jgi:hypothetical protein
MARKAMMYDRQTAKAKVVRKKVAKVGKKVLRPGPSTGKQAAQADALEGLRKNLRQSHHQRDAAELISALRTRRR